MDPKTAPKLEELDLLRFQVLNFRCRDMQTEINDMLRSLVVKYAGPGESIGINQETGEIERSPVEPPPAPPVAAEV